MAKFIPKDGFIIAVGLLIGFGIGLFVVINANDAFSLENGLIKDRVFIRAGADAPDFMLKNLNDETIQLKGLLGKPVILNFWATWCGPCRLEMPMMEFFYQNHIGEIELLAINMREKVRPVQIFVNELDLHFPILLDLEAEVSTLYRIQGLPTTIILSAEGKIAVVHVGVITESQLTGYLEKMGINDD